MGRLKIIADGSSPKDKARARGKLFETMMIRVLHHYGYSVDRILNANYTGMEIEIAGKHKVTSTPLFADCKFYETAISALMLQAFYGKYMTRWHQDTRCHGLFIALPGVDPSAREFYQEHIENNSFVTARLYEQDDVLKAISGTPGVVSPDPMAGRITRDMGKPGDCFLLYTEEGIFWVQFITSHGKRNPDRIALFDKKGTPISDRSILGYITKLYPDLDNFDNIDIPSTKALQPGLFQDTDEIVEVRGCSECFEYQFPASPEHLVGRKPLMKELDSFAVELINKKTPHRGILFEAPSGLGKSSLVLASVARLQKMGHFVVAIDSRTASSLKFIPRVINYTIEKFGNFGGLITEADSPKSITDFDSAAISILKIGQLLESHGKLMFIFLDHFENIFILPDVLKRIKDFFLKICEKQTNIVLGFSWNKDFILSTNAFSGELLGVVTNNSKKITLNTFSRAEIDALLKKLSNELDETLRKDLQSFLVEFSQGHPWLLKILCYHVKVARQSGIPQLYIAGNLLSIEELFQHDLQKLSDKESTSLLQIAKSVPMRLAESQGTFEPQVVQNLIKQRLIVRIGNTVDVYGDIFRDYLNTDVLPHWDNYILRAGAGNVLKTINILQASGGFLDMSEFQRQAGLPEKLFYRTAKDMDLLGFVKFIKGTATLQIKPPATPLNIEVLLRNHLRDRLLGNRMVVRLLKTLKKKNTLTIEEVSKLLEISCAYISATRQTWLKYSRILARWIDYADLAHLDNKNRVLIVFDPVTEIRERHLLLTKTREAKIPRIQYSPVENIAIRLVRALHGNGRVDWTGLNKSTIFRALATLEDLGFIIKKTRLIKVLPKGEEFVSNPDKRPILFAQSALKMNSFSSFIEILKAHQVKGNTLLTLGLELRDELGRKWEENTAKTIAKIMLDWARHTKLAPGVFAETRRGPIKGWKKKEDHQMTLF